MSARLKDLPHALESVILVDPSDQETGQAEKMAAHRQGVLHRAMSVMVWDRRGRMLLQKRHIGKYHSGGLWTNACCGHPRPGEAPRDAALRRLQEEMGFVCPLAPIGTMLYRAEVGAGLVEHELVHLFRGAHDGPVRPDPTECEGYAWAAACDIRAGVAATPERYSAWFAKYVAADWPVAPPS